MDGWVQGGGVYLEEGNDKRPQGEVGGLLQP